MGDAIHGSEMMFLDVGEAQLPTLVSLPSTLLNHSNS